MTDLTSNPVPIDPYDPVDLLSFIPYEFGYQPHDSLVAVTIRGAPTNPTFGLFGRLGVIPTEDPEASAARRAGFLANLHRQRTVDGYIVVYSEPFFAEIARGGGVADSHQGEVQAIFTELAHLYDYPAFTPRQTLVVGTSRWRCFTCPAPGHCPERGHPTADLSHTRISLEMVVQGRTYAPNRESLVTIPTYIPAPRAALEVADTFDRVRHGPQGLGSDRWKDRVGRRWQRAIDMILTGADPSRLPAEELSVLGMSLASIPVRDNVIYSLCTQRPLPDVRTESERHFAQMFTDEERPEPAVSAAGIELLKMAVKHCPPQFRAPALAVWGWCHWWNGHGTEADILVDHALGVDPHYSLARTLETVLAANLLPPWLKAQFTSEP